MQHDSSVPQAATCVHTTLYVPNGVCAGHVPSCRAMCRAYGAMVTSSLIARMPRRARAWPSCGKDGMAPVPPVPQGVSSSDASIAGRSPSPRRRLVAPNASSLRRPHDHNWQHRIVCAGGARHSASQPKRHAQLRPVPPPPPMAEWQPPARCTQLMPVHKVCVLSLRAPQLPGLWRSHTDAPTAHTRTRVAMQRLWCVCVCVCAR